MYIYISYISKSQYIELTIWVSVRYNRHNVSRLVKRPKISLLLLLWLGSRNGVPCLKVYCVHHFPENFYISWDTYNY